MLWVCLDDLELLHSRGRRFRQKRDPVVRVAHVHDGEHDSSAEEGRRGPWDRHRDQFQTFGGENVVNKQVSIAWVTPSEPQLMPIRN